MRVLFHQLVETMARAEPGRPALVYRSESRSYGELADAMERIALSLASLGLSRGARVAIYLEKRIEAVVAMLAVSRAGGVFVPINPILRAPQVRHVLADCGARVLITTRERLAALGDGLDDGAESGTILLVGPMPEDPLPDNPVPAGWCVLPWDVSATPGTALDAATIDGDVAAILYTSGSTGLPKGVVLSHRNLVAGAMSVSAYLANTAEDRILAVLPLSFDAGLSQVTTAFYVGAQVVLLNFLLPRDVVRACARHRITGITGVPPLWIKLAQEEWPEAATASLRYFANTGGHLPGPTLATLRAHFPAAAPFLMYGLTEAFRSTYLDPSEVDRRPDSMGKAIPNAEVLVINGAGEECVAGEVGELVHRGVLVSLGYWNDPERTAQRFRPLPGQEGVPIPEIAVWSGDLVRRDEEGFLYFVGRNDAMIKTSGYRVSPTEVEEALMRTGLVAEAVAFAVPHPELGQAIEVVAVAPGGQQLDPGEVLAACRRDMPTYMVPQTVHGIAELPRNANGKVDRERVRSEFSEPGSDQGLLDRGS